MLWVLGKLERPGRLKAAFLHHGGDRRTMGAGGGVFPNGSPAAPDAPDAPGRFGNIFQQLLTFPRQCCAMPEPVLEPCLFELAPDAPYPFMKKNRITLYMGVGIYAMGVYFARVRVTLVQTAEPLTSGNTGKTGNSDCIRLFFGKITGFRLYFA